MSDPNATPGFRLRVRYHKAGRLKYLAHLEVLRSVERIVRRARLPYAVTQGFSPHMKIAYSSALPVAVESFDEYFDLWLTEYIPSEDVFERLKLAAPFDLMVQEAAYMGIREPSLTAALTIARYRVTVVTDAFDAAALQGAFDAVLERGYVEYLRKDKLKRVELAGKLVEPPAIGARDDRTYEVSLVTRSSNEGALRPDVFVESVAEELLWRAGSDLVSARAQAFAAQGVPLGSKRERAFEECAFVRLEQLWEGEDGSWHRPLERSV